MDAQISSLDALPADIWAHIAERYLTSSDLVNLKLTGCHGVWYKLTRPGVVRRLSVVTDFPASKAPYKFLIGMPNLKHIEMTLSNTSTNTQSLMASLSRCLESLSLHWFPECYGRRWPGWSLGILPPSLVTFRSNMPIYDSDLVQLPRSLTSLELSRLHTIHGEGFSDLPPSLTHLRLCVTSDHLTTLTNNMPYLPRNLTSLELPYLSHINNEFVSSLPRDLTLLNMSRVHELSATELERLPRSLTHLNIKAATTISFDMVQYLPSSLIYLCWQPNEDLANFSKPSDKTCDVISLLPSQLTSFGELPNLIQRQYARAYLLRQLPIPETNPFPNLTTEVPRWVANHITDDLMPLLPTSIRSLVLSHNRVITSQGILRAPPHLIQLSLPNSPNTFSIPGSHFKYLPRSLRDLDIPHATSLQDSHIKELPPQLTRLKLCVEESRFPLTSAALAHFPSSLLALELPSCYLQVLGLPAVFQLTSSCQQINFGSGPAAVVVRGSLTSALLRDTFKRHYLTSSQIQWLFDDILSPLLSIIAMVLVAQVLFNHRFFLSILFAIAFVPTIVCLALFFIQRYFDPKTTLLHSLRPNGSILLPQLIAVALFAGSYLVHLPTTRLPWAPF